MDNNLVNNKCNLQTESKAIAYFNSLDPRIINPHTFITGGMTRISFNSNDGGINVSIYRTISKYVDKATGIQDEIHLNHSNIGIQYNFELDSEGNLIKYPEFNSFSQLMEQCLDVILKMVKQPGSIFESSDGFKAIANGELWVNCRIAPLNNSGEIETSKKGK